VRILFLDIETAPNLAHVWGVWQQNVGVNQIMESSYVLSWAAKWLGSKEVMFMSLHTTTSKRMIRSVHKLLNEADVVVHYNGTKFDIPTLNKEFLQHGLVPPAPFKEIDLLKTVRQRFRFPTNKLEYVVNALGLGSKHKHPGHEMWIGCMHGDPMSWKEMEKYNVQDTVLLEALYGKLRPWIKNHPNYSLYSDGGGQLCPNCGGTHLQRRGMARTAASLYIRYHCQDCGTWSRAAAGGKRVESLRNV
jgi:DNA polymerase elongation subunit (family B)